MAAEDEGRTEEPSEYKLKKARDEEGRVPKSQDLTSSIVFLICSIILIFSARSIYECCADVMRYYFNDAASAVIKSAHYTVFVIALARTVTFIALGGIATSVIVNIIQNKGFLFTAKLITPNFKKIIPKFGEYFKNTLFSAKGVFGVVKSILKVFIIAFIAFLVLHSALGQLTKGLLNTLSINSVVQILAKIVEEMLLITAVLFILLSIPDYLIQRRSFLDEMKMTKYELKQEYKEMEGDPDIKSRLDALQRQMVLQNMPKAVKEADVVITNPTHFAVALKYDREKDEAPKITAKGADELAFRMRALAKESGTPIIENRPLARGLYHDTEVGDTVPQKFLRVLADIYAQVMRMGKKSA